MGRVLIGIGANLGDPPQTFALAVELLQEYLQDVRVSRCYASAPMYQPDQPQFVNAALSAVSELGPWPLLQVLKQVETRLGRQARERNGPRELDLDLLAYGSLKYRFVDPDGERLAVPHPLLGERRFALLPLSELEPDLVIPGMGTVRSMLARTAGQVDDVFLYDHARLSLRSA